jgi:hypothetical protein
MLRLLNGRSRPRMLMWTGWYGAWHPSRRASGMSFREPRMFLTDHPVIADTDRCRW